MPDNTTTKKRQPWIGGPGSKLPFFLESILGWMLAISCLAVALYHYARQILLSSASTHGESTKLSPLLLLPLTTHSRKEILSKTTLQRYHQLTKFLETSDEDKSSIMEWTDDDLVLLIRSNLLVRRLVSLVMVKHRKDSDPNRLESLDLIQILTRIWPRLVELPKDTISRYTYDISIIVPAYREDGQQSRTKLKEAHDLATSTDTTTASRIEVIVVHTHCSNLHLLKGDFCKFAKITCSSDQGGGRGPCLNQGAALAQGRILTFLHADTRLSRDWNLAILQAFSSSSSSSSSKEEEDNKTIANSCAFSFAIDTSSIRTQSDYFPPGIRAIERTANWRSHWFHLPYGDQCLSIPHYIFNYIGGYPHQCLMEDYEVIRLLRQRVALSSSHFSRREVLKILDMPAKCHVRRWQTYGVLYVTFFNSKLVNLYSREQVTAEELFRLYYGMNNEGATQPIPWEAELDRFLHVYS
jgi:glycosyltransferase involved in cell wall biosynthesis